MSSQFRISDFGFAIAPIAPPQRRDAEAQSRPPQETLPAELLAIGNRQAPLRRQTSAGASSGRRLPSPRQRALGALILPTTAGFLCVFALKTPAPHSISILSAVICVIGGQTTMAAMATQNSAMGRWIWVDPVDLWANCDGCDG